MSHDLIIDRASNGWVITIPDDRPGFTDRVEVVEENEAATAAPPHGFDLLWFIIEELGLAGNRYAARRIYVGTKPGDKHHDNHPKPCSECECQCDPADDKEYIARLWLAGRAVMDGLEQHGPDIVPHHMDDDENDG